MGKWRKRLIQISVLGLILVGTGVLSASAAVKEGRPGETLKELAGGSLPWGKLSIMLETISNASGVYKYNSELTAIHINTPEAASYEYGSMGSRGALLVHEGQHRI